MDRDEKKRVNPQIRMRRKDKRNVWHEPSGDNSPEKKARRAIDHAAEFLSSTSATQVVVYVSSGEKRCVVTAGLSDAEHMALLQEAMAVLGSK